MERNLVKHYIAFIIYLYLLQMNEMYNMHSFFYYYDTEDKFQIVG